VDIWNIEEKQTDVNMVVCLIAGTVAHGQMPERQLEGVMRDFIAQLASCHRRRRR
jgi:transcription-repair coupling factor (superfamily II helicase)